MLKENSSRAGSFVIVFVWPIYILDSLSYNPGNSSSAGSFVIVFVWPIYILDSSSYNPGISKQVELLWTKLLWTSKKCIISAESQKDVNSYTFT